ncbi:winged helix-turn-helix transcriptional regulator [Actinomadura madurae]|uniref:winged helix-turn-helix transcriptional regulator n=1 Tax=Actinomadura madurae TaxID=1993 RepID=UPI002026B29C|nr:winged helix-turn-helix transcriptional regulator [Actinomadura madurae]MCP9953127.1 winged helix-turn-helix transcriptional regulator [Actinomadura madurae]MCP9969893.1 winged helix-turn-helix transcriptional regulator [Actinomadura madurae]MCP9982340.1 winged helix-turn-helix transcriptional regulator [Actinomadura madurae]MCQ0006127.1 winged helix-turn-helix transcriptional regulator [Actinomadura madurae]URM98602.1 winged helix-turn-helix transcriptional regulator [Actinomadura madurae]
MEQRTYNQYCATARTLDIVGERWTLLLVRELLTGPKRFGDLGASLRGLGTGLLAARLKHLEREGLVRKITLPPPARTPAYALTEAGEDLGPAVMALARWGLKWAMGERRESETFHPGWTVLGLRASFDPEAAAGLRAVYEFRVDDEVFHARIDDGTIEALHGPAQHPDATITIGEEALVGLTGTGGSFAEAIRDGSASASGDPEALRRLAGLFSLPPPGSREPAG